MRLLLPVVSIAVVTIVTGCANASAKVTLTAIDRAAFDRSCPRSSLPGTPRGDTTGVERTVVASPAVGRRPSTSSNV